VGYDPLGMMRRTASYAQAMRARGVERIFVYICNGQSDAGIGTARYQTALQYMIDDYRAQGFEVIVGLSTFAVTSTLPEQHWNELSAAITNIFATAAYADDPGVHRGANLYELMGSVAGDNGLTYTADNVHLDAPAQIQAGEHHANAIKAILPVVE